MTGPQGECRCSSTISLTSLLNGEWVVDTIHRLLYPWDGHPVPIVQKVGWAPGPVWTGAENLATIGV